MRSMGLMRLMRLMRIDESDGFDEIENRISVLFDNEIMKILRLFKLRSLVNHKLNFYKQIFKFILYFYYYFNFQYPDYYGYVTLGYLSRLII